MNNQAWKQPVVLDPKPALRRFDEVSGGVGGPAWMKLVIAGDLKASVHGFNEVSGEVGGPASMKPVIAGDCVGAPLRRGVWRISSPTWTPVIAVDPKASVHRFGEVARE